MGVEGHDLAEMGGRMPRRSGAIGVVVRVTHGMRPRHLSWSVHSYLHGAHSPRLAVVVNRNGSHDYDYCMAEQNSR